MRVWLLSTALAAVVLAYLPGMALAAPTPTAVPAKSTSAPAAPPTATPAPPTATPPPPTATPPPPTATAPPKPTATAVPPTATAPPKPTSAPLAATSAPVQTPAAASAPARVTTAAPSATAAATAQQTVAPTAQQTAGPTATGVRSGAIHGTVFTDSNADGQLTDGEAPISQFTVTLFGGNGSRTTTTNGNGAFTFDGLVPGTYRVIIQVPSDMVPTTDAGQDVTIPADADPPDVLFGLISASAAGVAVDQASTTPEMQAEEADDEQVMALSSVTSLPLRFADGRDLMAQLERRMLGDGLIWLGVPFKSQMDGGNFQYVNCGPASLTMVLAGFGLDVGPSQVRDYLNNMIDNFNTDLGTSLDALSQIGKRAGLTPMDLYSEQGGYRVWSTDAVRWHIQQGHPVITLVKYRNLPGHGSSRSDWDHYIVISGLTPNGFIYNDAAFATTLGYGLEISDVELEYAWDNSSIPHYALALGLDPDQTALSFPEAPRPRRPVAEAVPAGARNLVRQAQADEVERAPLTLTPTAPTVAPPSPAGPLITTSDRWEDEADLSPPPADGAPMGLNMQQTETPALVPQPGPGAEVPKVLLLLSPAVLLWGVWSFSGAVGRLLFVRSRPR
ncbi:MAG: C39 family peptidase [Chloroflexi bacterium]|nr:C39 family peptidase [Chloroflexota bacterium]